MGIYEVVLRTRFAGQDCINRWNYYSVDPSTTPNGSIALLQATGLIPSGTPAEYPEDGILNRLQTVLSTGMTFESVSARHIHEVGDFYEFVYPGGTAGIVTGPSAPPVTALGYFTNRVRQDIRRATKRFAGVPEAILGTEGVLDPTSLAAIKLVGVAMSASVSAVVGATEFFFDPCVCKKMEYTTEKGTKAYKYYPTEAEQVAQMVTGIIWTEYDTARSQTSRQYGRGR